MSSIAAWLFDNVPLGRLAPFVLGIAIGKSGKKIEKENQPKDYRD